MTLHAQLRARKFLPSSTLFLHISKFQSLWTGSRRPPWSLPRSLRVPSRGWGHHLHAALSDLEFVVINPNWAHILSSRLLGLRTCVRLNLDASPAEFVFGTVLRIPDEFYIPGDFEPNHYFFLEEFQRYMEEIKPVPTRRLTNTELNRSSSRISQLACTCTCKRSQSSGLSTSLSRLLQGFRLANAIDNLHQF